MQENTKKKYSINIRFFTFLEYIGISRYAFSKKTGISETVLLNIYKNKNKISTEVIEKLLNNYEVNPTWLLTGKGKMIEVEKNIVSEQSAEYKTNKENFLLNMLDKKDKEITQLNRTIGKLENQIEQLKK